MFCFILFPLSGRQGIVRINTFHKQIKRLVTLHSMTRNKSQEMNKRSEREHIRKTKDVKNEKICVTTSMIRAAVRPA